MGEVYDDRYNKFATRYIKQRVSDVAPTWDSADDSSPNKVPKKIKPALWTSILAGGVAGVVVDISLYPLDTIKTRLQSSKGFGASGGFRGIYKGILPILVGSAPLSALFFATYNTLVNTLRTENSSENPLVYLIAATGAEVICATIKVPMEIIKQRRQTSSLKNTLIMKHIFREEGFSGFYRGFWSTLLREIPFAAIQFPLWEYMIQQLIIYEHGKELTALQTAYCGSAAGAIAAAVTTPMDVIKTRVMLADKKKIESLKPYVNINYAKEIYEKKGVRGLFAGVIPRVLWIMLGGFIYFGAYEKSKILWEQGWSLSDQIVKSIPEESPSYSEETYNFSTEKLPDSEQVGKPQNNEKEDIQGGEQVVEVKTATESYDSFLQK